MRCMRRRAEWCATRLALLLASGASSALALSTSAPPVIDANEGGAPAPESSRESEGGGDEPWYRYWEEQRPRVFLGGNVAVGAFNQASLQLGYGRPQWIWGALQLQGASTTEFGALLTNLRFDGILLNAQLGVRRTWAYERRRPRRSSSYSAFGDSSDPRNHYSSLDTWLWGYVPLGAVLGYWEVSGIWVFGDFSEHAIFSEYHRFTLNEQLSLMPRATIWIKLHGERILVGPAADVVLSPTRPALVRIGASFIWQFTPHLSLSALASVPAFTPDDYDLCTQSWGIFRLTYAFATGEPRPGL